MKWSGYSRRNTLRVGGASALRLRWRCASLSGAARAVLSLRFVARLSPRNCPPQYFRSAILRRLSRRAPGGLFCGSRIEKGSWFVGWFSIFVTTYEGKTIRPYYKRITNVLRTYYCSSTQTDRQTNKQTRARAIFSFWGRKKEDSSTIHGVFRAVFPCKYSHHFVGFDIMLLRCFADAPE